MSPRKWMDLLLFWILYGGPVACCLVIVLLICARRMEVVDSWWLALPGSLLGLLLTIRLWLVENW